MFLIYLSNTRPEDWLGGAARGLGALLCGMTLYDYLWDPEKVGPYVWCDTVH